MKLDSHDNVWIMFDIDSGTGAEWGLSKYDGTTWTHYLANDLPGAILPPEQYPNDFIVDDEDIVWIAAAGDIIRFDGAGYEFYGEELDIGTASIYSIDSKNRIWIYPEKYGIQYYLNASDFSSAQFNQSGRIRCGSHLLW